MHLHAHASFCPLILASACGGSKLDNRSDAASARPHGEAF